MTELSDILLRLERLEAAEKIRRCMNSYMRQCDDLNEYSSLDDLMQLFARGAIWEGVGDLYKERLGSHKGLPAIRKMFAKYTKPPAHFLFNLHVLGNELIEVDGDEAKGSWVLIQPSDFVDGRSHLNGAFITCKFKREKSQWKISHFQTRNLFSRGVDKPWSEVLKFSVPK